ncbi:MAG: hypothetical protein HC824_14300 [Synechococcales cyanobacterium RM1_1_8]|nr:hypothetical protein [Synechococcales cyanobacterium RM1_1_8]
MALQLAPLFAFLGLVLILLGLGGCDASTPSDSIADSIAQRRPDPSASEVSVAPGAETGAETGAVTPASEPLLEIAAANLELAQALPPVELPAGVGGRILAVAAEDQKLSLATLRIQASRDREWDDGCLNLAGEGEVCIQAITWGWQTLIGDGVRQWVYHSDHMGEQVRLNGLASDTEARISFGPLAQRGQLDSGVVAVRAMSQQPGDRPHATALMVDGSVVKLDAQGRGQGPGYSLTPAQVQAFDQQRNQFSLSRFNGLRYGRPGSANLADAPGSNQTWVSLIDDQSLFQYDPAIAAQLPPALERLEQAWQATVCASPSASPPGNCPSSPNSPAAE